MAQDILTATREATTGLDSEYSYDAAVADAYMTLYLKSIGAGQFGQLSQREKAAAKSALQDINSRLSPEEQATARQWASAYVLENSSAVASQNTTVQDFRSTYKASGLAQLGMSLAGAALSIPQIVKGRKILKNTELPKFPDFEPGNAIGDRINEIRREIESGSPEQRSLLEQRAANVIREGQAAARATGQVGDFLSGSQEAVQRAAEVRREGAAQMDALDQSRQARLDQLIGLQEDQRRFDFNTKVREFESKLYPEFLRRTQAGEALVNSGITNLFNSAQAAASAAPMFAAFRSLDPGEQEPPQPSVFGRPVQRQASVPATPTPFMPQPTPPPLMLQPPVDNYSTRLTNLPQDAQDAFLQSLGDPNSIPNPFLR